MTCKSSTGCPFESYRRKSFCLQYSNTSMPHVLCLMTSQSSITVDGHSPVPHCGASSSCLRAFMEELTRHNIGISYATTHGQDCSVYVEEPDSEWYFSNSAAYDHPKSLSECSISDFDGLLIPSSYGGLTDLVSSRCVAQRALVSPHALSLLAPILNRLLLPFTRPPGKLQRSFQNFLPSSCRFVW